MNKKKTESKEIVYEHTVWAMVGVFEGTSPGEEDDPLHDTKNTVAVHYTMIRRIDSIYGIKITKAVLTKLLGVSAGGGAAFGVAKYVTGRLSMPAQVFAIGVYTYALGMAYIEVLEKGKEIIVKNIMKKIPDYFEEGADYVTKKGIKRALLEFGKNFWDKTKVTVKILKNGAVKFTQKTDVGVKKVVEYSNTGKRKVTKTMVNGTKLVVTTLKDGTKTVIKFSEKEAIQTIKETKKKGSQTLKKGKDALRKKRELERKGKVKATRLVNKIKRGVPKIKIPKIPKIKKPWE